MNNQKHTNLDPVKISVVTVCYNMAEYIEQTIKSVLDQDYPNLEILALNDNSSDNTGQIIAQYETNHSQVSGYEGESLPADWLGKNWACWQLSRVAKGNILLFVDADTWHNRNAISSGPGPDAPLPIE